MLALNTKRINIFLLVKIIRYYSNFIISVNRLMSHNNKELTLITSKTIAWRRTINCKNKSESVKEREREKKNEGNRDWWKIKGELSKNINKAYFSHLNHDAKKKTGEKRILLKWRNK